MSNNVEQKINKLVDRIMDLISSDDEFLDFTTAIARKESGTENWTQEKWEQEENSAQYKLYYATLNDLQVKIATTAAARMGGHYKD